MEPRLRIEHEYRVRFDEADAEGWLRPSGLLRYAQDMAWRHSTEAGFDRAWYEARGMNWLVRNVTVLLLAPLTYGDVLPISTEVIGWRHVWARRGARIHPQEVMPTLGAAVLIFEETDLADEAEEMSAELVELARNYPYEAIWNLSLDFLFSRAATRQAPSLRPSLEAAPDWPWRGLALATLDGDFVRAADTWASAGSPTGEARLRLRAAEDLSETGRPDESREQAEQALAFHDEVGATRYVELENRLLQRSG